jgi:hypothetical protein
MKERPFEVGNQVLISSHRKLLLFQRQCGERCGNVGTMILAGTADRASRGASIALQHYAIAFARFGSSCDQDRSTLMSASTGSGLSLHWLSSE